MPYFAAKENIMDFTQIVPWLITAILILLGLVIAIVAYRLIIAAKLKVTNPTLEQVLSALDPIARKGIYYAESLALKTLKDTQVVIAGADKLKIAVSTYSAITGFIEVAGGPVAARIVKTLVTQDAYAALVQQIFDEMDLELTNTENYLIDQVNTIVPPAPVLPGNVG
jgi:hypothetical protein